MTEVEITGCHQQLHGPEFEQTPGDSEGQGRLAGCSPWGCKESDMTYQLNNNNNNKSFWVLLTGLKTKMMLGLVIWDFKTGKASGDGKPNVY